MAIGKGGIKLSVKLGYKKAFRNTVNSVRVTVCSY
jgi:hypothetical protein